MNNLKIRFKREQAFSIAEVLVSVALLGILFVSLYAGMTSGFAFTQSARENLRATQIMLERMEGVRLYNWDQLIYSNWIPSSFTAYYYPLGDSKGNYGIEYSGSMRVEAANLNPPATYSSNMRAVRVNVTWKTGSLEHHRTMVTYVAKAGVQNYVYSDPNR
jgi:type II secretory pathway pseudopilin PulG